MPQNPCQNALSTLAFLSVDCAKQRISSKTFHSRPNCCIFLQQTAPFSPIGERTFLSCVRSPPCLGRKNRRSPQAASRRMPGRADDCEPDAPPQTGRFAAPSRPRDPGARDFPFCLYLENHTARFPGMEKGPRLQPEALEWFWVYSPEMSPFSSRNSRAMS